MSNRSKHTRQLAPLIPDLMKLARILAPSPDMAEDMAQDALLNVWSQMTNGTDIKDLRPYLMTTLRNRSRHPGRTTLGLDVVAEPSHDAEAPGRLATAEVLQAIHKLPKPQSDLLSDLALNEPSYGELAARHDVPIGTVMSRIARARRNLRCELDLPKQNPTATQLGDGG